MPEQVTKEESVIFEITDGREFDARIDFEGDLLIQLTDSERTEPFYIRRTDALRLRDFLNKVL